MTIWFVPSRPMVTRGPASGFFLTAALGAIDQPEGHARALDILDPGPAYNERAQSQHVHACRPSRGGPQRPRPPPLRATRDAFVLRPEARAVSWSATASAAIARGETASAAVVAVLPAMLESPPGRAPGRAPRPWPSPARRGRGAERRAAAPVRRVTRRSPASAPPSPSRCSAARTPGSCTWATAARYRLRGDRFRDAHRGPLARRAAGAARELSPEEAGDRPEFAGLTRYVGMEGVVYPDVRPEQPEPGDRLPALHRRPDRDGRGRPGGGAARRGPSPL